MDRRVVLGARPIVPATSSTLAVGRSVSRAATFSAVLSATPVRAGRRRAATVREG